MSANGIKQWVGVVFALALLACVEILLYRISGSSFTTSLLNGSAMPIVVFVAGCVIGMAWEYLGQFSFAWWHYPSANKHPRLLALLPLFWGIFMLIMQDGYAIARIEGFGQIPAVILSTVTLGFLIEGINLYTGSWVYTGRANSIPLLIFGWIILLAFTFVTGFNAFILNPFGL